MLKINKNTFWTKNEQPTKYDIFICALNSGKEDEVFKLGKVESELWILITENENKIEDLEQFFSKTNQAQDFVKSFLSYLVDRNFIETDWVLSFTPTVELDIGVVDITKDVIGGDEFEIYAYATCSAPCTCTKVRE